MNRVIRLIAVLAGAGLISVHVGCGSGDSADAMFKEANDMNIKRVSSLYSVFQGQHNFVGPQDELEFRSFISKQDKKRLKRIGVDLDDLDNLFISERDGQPFKIRWQVTCRPRSGPIPIVFESEGVDGKYMVAFSSYLCKEVEKSEYDQLWEGKMDDAEPDSNRGGVPGR